MRKILTAAFLAAASIAAASSASADQTAPSTTTGPLGIECVRWDVNALKINCNAHPWKWVNRDSNVLEFSSIQDIYDHGYKVVAMHEEVDRNGGQYSYMDYIIEKRADRPQSTTPP